MRRLLLWEIDFSFVVYTHHFIHPHWVGKDTERSEESPARGALAFYLVKWKQVQRILLGGKKGTLEKTQETRKVFQFNSGAILQSYCWCLAGALFGIALPWVWQLEQKKNKNKSLLLAAEAQVKTPS